MKLIGLVGGIASGKSFVAKILAELGARVLDADQMAHQLLETEPVIQLLVDRWGKSVLGSDGRLQRGQIARIVFGAAESSGQELAWLESQLHPRIHQQVEREIAEAKKAGDPAVVLDAPVLIKAGWHHHCDEIVFVDCSRDLQLVRIRERGWDDAELSRRQSYQTPLEEKRRLATFIVQNDAGAESTRQQLMAFWQQRVLNHCQP